jgi:ceramide glucosyltransferase
MKAAMTIIEHLLGWAASFCVVSAAIGCVYTAVAAILTLSFGRARHAAKPGPQALPPVTILVPLCGDEAGLRSRLHALCVQDYPAPVQVLCGVRDPADPAVAVVNRLAAELPRGTVSLHIDPRMHGRNPKISNLMNMMEHARHDVFVMIDSDIEVVPDYLSRVILELGKPGVGAVTCLYHGIARSGLWARLAAMDINLQFLPSAIIAMRFALARPCFGATVAVTKETLHEIGGLVRFADQLWDDYAIGEAVRAAGYDVAVPPLAVGHACMDGSARELFARQLRYARTIRSIDPAGKIGAIITHPFPLALLAILFGGGYAAVALACTTLACRGALAACVAHRFPNSSAPYWLLPLRDLAAFVIYVMGFFGGTVVWRGRRYRVRPDGTLLQASQ